MSIFGPNKKYVSRNEFQEVRSLLRAKGFDKKKTDEVETFFRGDLHEHEPGHIGIDKKEIENGITWLRENKEKHSFSDAQIDTIEEALNKKL